MFENAQQEENSGSGKIVGGVIAVAMIIIGVGYFMYFQDASQPAQTAGGDAAATTPASDAKADPMNDLKIMKSNLRQDQTQTMALWDVVVANRSRDFSYRNIKYATNYYNAQAALLYSNEGTLPEPVEPNGQQTFSSINDGLYPVGTASFTIELKGAEPVQ